jgi:hypothetical protein
MSGRNAPTEQRRGVEARPPAPEWLLERGLTGRDAVYAHVLLRTEAVPRMAQSD